MGGVLVSFVAVTNNNQSIYFSLTLHVTVGACRWPCVSPPHVSSPGPSTEGAAPTWHILFSKQRKELSGGRNSDSELLLGHDILHVHSYAVGQCYSHKVNIREIGCHSLGGTESHTAIGRDVKSKKGRTNAQEQSYHRNAEGDASNLPGTQ